VFFAGDTALHPEFRDIAARFGPFDLTIIPIGAYAPPWMMQPVHMNPDEAVAAYGALAAVHAERGWPRPAMLPIHWGTFHMSDEAFDEPPRRLLNAWTVAGHDRDGLWLLGHGETRQADST
jgi:L-ascorbate metabolism protein UlaG (beta-lactamase superfamily)